MIPINAIFYKNFLISVFITRLQLQQLFFCCTGFTLDWFSTLVPELDLLCQELQSDMQEAMLCDDDGATGTAETSNTTVVPKKRKRRTLGSYCAAYGCHNSRRNCTLSMFRFPKEKERCRKWVQNTRRDDLRTVPLERLYTYELCSNHFENSQFTNPERKNRLTKHAIPTLFNVPNPPQKITPTRPLKKRNGKVQSKSSESIDCIAEPDACTPSTSTEKQQCDTPKKKTFKAKNTSITYKTVAKRTVQKDAPQGIC